MLIHHCTKIMLLVLIAALAACTSHPELETTIAAPTPDSRFSDPKVISPATAADVTQLKRYGVGYQTSVYAWAQKVPKLAIVSEAGINIYDATARREVRFIETPGTMVSVALSPDGRILAAGGEDNSLVLMEVATGNLLYTLQAHSQDLQITSASPHVRELAFTPSGRQLATIDTVDREVIKLWDVETGRLLTTYGMPGEVDRIGFVNEQLLVTQGPGNAVKLWNTVMEQTWIVYHQSVLNWNFQPDGTLATMDDRDQTLSLWDAATYHKKSSLPLQAELDRIINQASSTDGQVVAIQSFGALKIWDGSTGHLLQAVSQSGMRGLTFSPDNKLLAWVSDNNIVHLWDVATGGREVHLQLKRDARFAFPLSFAPDGKTLAVIYATDTGPHAMKQFIELWDVATGQELAVFDSSYRSLYVGVAPCSPALVAYDVKKDSGQNSDVIPVIDVNTGRQLLRLPKGYPLTVMGDRLIAVNIGSVYSNSYVELWDVEASRQLHRLEHRILDWTKMEFSPDGQWLAITGYDGTGLDVVQIWNVATGQREVSLPTGSISALAYAPNGKILATVRPNGEIVFWDVTTGSTTRTLNTSVADVSALSFSPDGRRLAVAEADTKTIHVWDITTNQESLIFTAHSAAIKALAFSPDGRVLASASDDHTLKLWEVATGHELRTLRGHNGPVDKVVFSADGKHLVSGSYDGTVRVWGVL